MRSPSAALALARTEGKALLVDFYASWCPPCRLLEATTLRDPIVWSALGVSFVPLRIDVTEDTARSKALLEAFRVDSLPALVALDPAGQELGRLTTFLPAEGLTAWLEQMARRSRERQPSPPPSP